jgi:hypothetical protein
MFQLSTLLYSCVAWRYGVDANVRVWSVGKKHGHQHLFYHRAAVLLNAMKPLVPCMQPHELFMLGMYIHFLFVHTTHTCDCAALCCCCCCCAICPSVHLQWVSS